MDNHLEKLYEKALASEYLSQEEGITLYKEAPTAELMKIAHQLRMEKKKDNKVTWIIDRNVNTTNVCVANCKFCNFFRPPGHADGYITTMDQYRQKIKETFSYGGRQLLLQGGHHPELGLDYYVNLFADLKAEFPNLKLHALGPPEIVHIAKLEQATYKEVLQELKQAGLDSLPGAGAEILNDRVRRLISNGKCSGQEWLDVMRAAHQVDLTTSATMMFGHIETIEERFEHFVWIREVQDEKPKNAKGFLAFIPWPFQDQGTLLTRIRGVRNEVTGDEYLRMIALSRIMLPNIINIQASWLTVGKKVGQLSLFAGANDWGSIMIEENVVSAAGAPHRFTSKTIQEAILETGFHPQLRNQEYEDLNMPEEIIEQKINY